MAVSTHRSSTRSLQDSYEEAMALFPSCSREPVERRISDTTVLAIERLQRIQRVDIRQVFTKHGHRHLVLDVTRRSLHAWSCVSTYEVEHRLAALRGLSAQLLLFRGGTASSCAACASLQHMLAENHHELSRLHPLGHRPSHLQRFLTAVVHHITNGSAHHAAVCLGCEQSVRLVADFLRPQYRPSTGLI